MSGDPQLRPIFEEKDRQASSLIGKKLLGNYHPCLATIPQVYLPQVRQYGETYLPDQYVIHDPSRVVVAGDYGLMVAVTGKEQGRGEQTWMSLP